MPSTHSLLWSGAGTRVALSLITAVLAVIALHAIWYRPPLFRLSPFLGGPSKLGVEKGGPTGCLPSSIFFFHFAAAATITIYATPQQTHVLDPVAIAGADVLVVGSAGPLQHVLLVLSCRVADPTAPVQLGSLTLLSSGAMTNVTLRVAGNTTGRPDVAPDGVAPCAVVISGGFNATATGATAGSIVDSAFIFTGVTLSGMNAVAGARLFAPASVVRTSLVIRNSIVYATGNGSCSWPPPASATAATAAAAVGLVGIAACTGSGAGCNVSNASVVVDASDVYCGGPAVVTFAAAASALRAFVGVVGIAATPAASTASGNVTVTVFRNSLIRAGDFLFNFSTSPTQRVALVGCVGIAFDGASTATALTAAAVVVTGGSAVNLDGSMTAASVRVGAALTNISRSVVLGVGVATVAAAMRPQAPTVDICNGSVIDLGYSSTTAASGRRMYLASGIVNALVGGAGVATTLGNGGGGSAYTAVTVRGASAVSVGNLRFEDETTVGAVVLGAGAAFYDTPHRNTSIVAQGSVRLCVQNVTISADEVVMTGVLGIATRATSAIANYPMVVADNNSTLTLKNFVAADGSVIRNFVGAVGITAGAATVNFATVAIGNASVAAVGDLEFATSQFWALVGGVGIAAESASVIDSVVILDGQANPTSVGVFNFRSRQGGFALLPGVGVAMFTTGTSVVARRSEVRIILHGSTVEAGQANEGEHTAVAVTNVSVDGSLFVFTGGCGFALAGAASEVAAVVVSGPTLTSIDTGSSDNRTNDRTTVQAATIRVSNVTSALLSFAVLGAVGISQHTATATRNAVNVSTGDFATSIKVVVQNMTARGTNAMVGIAGFSLSSLAAGALPTGVLQIFDGAALASNASSAALLGRISFELSGLTLEDACSVFVGGVGAALMGQSATSAATVILSATAANLSVHVHHVTVLGGVTAVVGAYGLATTAVLLSASSVTIATPAVATRTDVALRADNFLATGEDETLLAVVLGAGVAAAGADVRNLLVSVRSNATWPAAVVNDTIKLSVADSLVAGAAVSAFVGTLGIAVHQSPLDHASLAVVATLLNNSIDYSEYSAAVGPSSSALAAISNVTLDVRRALALVLGAGIACSNDVGSSPAAAPQPTVALSGASVEVSDVAILTASLTGAATVGGVGLATSIESAVTRPTVNVTASHVLVKSVVVTTGADVLNATDLELDEPGSAAPAALTGGVGIAATSASPFTNPGIRVDNTTVILLGLNVSFNYADGSLVLGCGISCGGGGGDSTATISLVAPQLNITNGSHLIVVDSRLISVTGANVIWPSASASSGGVEAADGAPHASFPVVLGAGFALYDRSNVTGGSLILVDGRDVSELIVSRVALGLPNASVVGGIGAATVGDAHIPSALVISVQDVRKLLVSQLNVTAAGALIGTAGHAAIGTDDSTIAGSVVSFVGGIGISMGPSDDVQKRSCFRCQILVSSVAAVEVTHVFLTTPATSAPTSTAMAAQGVATCFGVGFALSGLNATAPIVSVTGVSSLGLSHLTASRLSLGADERSAVVGGIGVAATGGVGLTLLSPTIAATSVTFTLSDGHPWLGNPGEAPLAAAVAFVGLAVAAGAISRPAVNCTGVSNGLRQDARRLVVESDQMFSAPDVGPYTRIIASSGAGNTTTAPAPLVGIDFAPSVSSSAGTDAGSVDVARLTVSDSLLTCGFALDPVPCTVVGLRSSTATPSVLAVASTTIAVCDGLNFADSWVGAEEGAIRMLANRSDGPPYYRALDFRPKLLSPGDSPVVGDAASIVTSTIYSPVRAWASFVSQDAWSLLEAAGSFAVGSNARRTCPYGSATVSRSQQTPTQSASLSGATVTRASNMTESSSGTKTANTLTVPQTPSARLTASKTEVPTRTHTRSATFSPSASLSGPTAVTAATPTLSLPPTPSAVDTLSRTGQLTPSVSASRTMLRVSLEEGLPAEVVKGIDTSISAGAGAATITAGAVPTLALQVSMGQALLSMAQCGRSKANQRAANDDGAVALSFPQSFVPGLAIGSGPRRYYRGAVVAAVGGFALAAVVLTLAGFLFLRFLPAAVPPTPTASSLARATVAAFMPGTVMLVASMGVDGAVSGSVMLVRGSDDDPVTAIDYALAAVCLATVATLAGVTRWGVHRLFAAAASGPAASTSVEPRAVTFVAGLRVAPAFLGPPNSWKLDTIEYLFFGRGKWLPTPAAGSYAEGMAAWEAECARLGRDPASAVGALTPDGARSVPTVATVAEHATALDDDDVEAEMLEAPLVNVRTWEGSMSTEDVELLSSNGSQRADRADPGGPSSEPPQLQVQREDRKSAEPVRPPLDPVLPASERRLHHLIISYRGLLPASVSAAGAHVTAACGAPLAPQLDSAGAILSVECGEESASMMDVPHASWRQPCYFFHVAFAFAAVTSVLRSLPPLTDADTELGPDKAATAACAPQIWALFGVQLVFACYVAYLRPHCVPFSNVVSCASAVVTAAGFLLLGLEATFNAAGMRAPAETCSAIVSVLSFVSIARTAARTALTTWQRALRVEALKDLRAATRTRLEKIAIVFRAQFMPLHAAAGVRPDQAGEAPVVGAFEVAEDAAVPGGVPAAVDSSCDMTGITGSGDVACGESQPLQDGGTTLGSESRRGVETDYGLSATSCPESAILPRVDSLGQSELDELEGLLVTARREFAQLPVAVPISPVPPPPPPMATRIISPTEATVFVQSAAATATLNYGAEVARAARLGQPNYFAFAERARLHGAWHELTRGSAADVRMKEDMDAL